MLEKSNLSTTILAVALHFLCKSLDKVAIILTDAILKSNLLRELSVEVVVYLAILSCLILCNYLSQKNLLNKQ